MSSPPANPGTRFDGKVAFITGSSRGMGWQNAIELPSRRASIVINYANSAFAADNVVKESKAAEIVQFFGKAIDHFGRLDIVVSNSGVEHFGEIEDVTAEDIDRVFAVNTRGQFLVAHHGI